MVRNNKKGVVLPLVAVGIMAVAGLVPFLISNTETNNSVNISLDETNKQTWALQSAVEEKINNSKNSINPVLKTLTQNELPENEIKFNYGNDNSNPESMAGFEAKASVVEYNSYLNKNSCYYAHIHDAEGYDLSGINAVGVKPGIAIVNNTTYVWDKYGFLYEVKDNKLIKQDVKDNNGNNKRVWQVVSDGVNPVILTANDSLSAINTKNKSNYGDGYYEFVAKSDDFQAGIKQKDKANLAIPNNNSAANNFNADHPNVKVEDVSVSSNHGLALVAYKNDENKNVWEVWGWGNNSSDQLVCTNKDAKNEDKKDVYTQLTKISEIFSKCTASGNSGAVIDISPYRDIELNDNKDSISSYFHDYYKYTYKNGHYYVKDPKTGEETLHYTGSKSGKGNTTCNCAFCKDLGDAYIGKPSTELPVPLTINEDQALEQLELLVDGSGDSKIAKKLSDSTTLKCVIKSVDNPSFELTFEGGKVNDDEEVYTPYGDINIVVWDKNKLLDSNGNYYNLPKGKYQCEFYVSKKNGKWQALQAGDMFWGWIDRDSAGATQSMGGNISEANVYGGVFRLNHNLYNLRGGTAPYGYDVNFYAVAAGENFSLAVVSPKIEGEGRPKYSVIGWGDATKGQLGTGIGKSKEQMILIDQSDLPANIIEKYRDMKAGVDHALFLTTDGEVYGWGGSSDSENIYKVHKIEFNGNPKIIYIAVGNGKSAALDENGNIYEWSVVQGSSGNTINSVENIGGNNFAWK